MPGTRPTTVSADFVIPVPGTNVTVAEVSSRSGGLPTFARPRESAIENHEACAAAISSSGLVLPPCSSSDREAHVICNGPNAPLGASWISPLPDIRSPCHVTCALRSAMSHLQFCFDRHFRARLDQLGERAALVRLLHDTTKRVLVDTRDARAYTQLRLDD